MHPREVHKEHRVDDSSSIQVALGSHVRISPFPFLDNAHTHICHPKCRDGDLYSGEYSCDKGTGVVHGCPALSDTIRELLQSIKTRDRATGASAMRGHAEAMSLEDLTRIMEWSRTICPESWSSVQVAPSPDTDEMTELVAKHLFMRAYMSTAFTLWTRNNELCKLKKSHVQDVISYDGHSLPYFTVVLENRKGWQKKVGYEGQLIGM